MRQAIGILAVTAVTAVVLFATAGTVAWWNGWAVVGFLLGLGAATSRVIEQSPGLKDERSKAAAQAPRWDRIMVRLTNLALPATLLAAALERRLEGRAEVPVIASGVAFALMLPAAVLTYRAMAANAFFSSHVRIQHDRAHVVVSSGPYGVLRHPGYAGAAAFNLLLPVALGSWWALLPGILAVALLVWRTSKEDRFLVTQLPGYAAYASRVRYRLIPGVW
jgi:protein-S-isoprenylcysteine O-methyltransferase Ste14